MNVLRYIEGKGIPFFELAKSQNLEGIVAKRKDSLYKINSRTKDWIKIKFLKDEDFVVCGYILKMDKGYSVVSIILGTYHNDKLISQGHVTMGVSRDEFKIIQNQEVLADAPFEKKESEAVYNKPDLVCSVKYMERTPQGGLRQPVFKGLRMDKLPKDCILKKF